MRAGHDFHPLAGLLDRLMTDNTARPPLHDGESPPILSIQDIRVLVVDDSEYMLKLMREFLAILGLRSVSTVGDGESALKVLARDEPHLVITDLKMLPMSGLEFIAAVRSGRNIPNPSIPIVVVTGFADLKTVQRLTAAGASGVLVKPVSLVALRERVLPLLPLPRALDAEPRPGSWAFQI